MDTPKAYTILISETEATEEGAEGVYATISNDYAKDEHGARIFGKEYGYEMWGEHLHGPIPALPRAGFATAEEAEDATRREYKELRAG